MNMIDKWRSSANLSREEQAKIWNQMSGEERKIAWQEHYAQQRQQATPPMSESERNYRMCTANVDPNSKWGQIMQNMKARGCFDAIETRTIVDENGIHDIRVKV